MTDALFVYGSLRSEFDNPYAVALRAEADFVCRATVRGSIVSVGQYPGYRPEPDGVVQGEVWRLRDFEKTSAMLDEYEGSRYRRVLVATSIGQAWIYEYTNFSSRLPHGVETNALTRLLENRQGVLDLTESNPTRAGIVYPDGFLNALSDPRAMLYEPEPFGLPATRELIGPVESVAVTASTSEAYSWLFKLLCDPGDEILIPRPSYPLFDYLAKLESTVVRHYGLFYDHGAWCIDFHTITAALNERTRAIVVVNPNNPTGHFIARRELDELRVLCSERGIAIISDEVFQDYVISPREESAPTLGGSESALTFTLHGLSKAVGLPQMKLAWMLMSGAPALVREARERLEMIADTYLSAATPVQCALPSLLALREPIQQQIIERLRSNLEYLRGTGLRVLEVEAGWYATVSTNRGDDFAEQLLREQNVLVQPGYFYDFEGSGNLVLSLLTKPEVFREGVTRLQSELSQSLPQSTGA